jgi:tetratricopeptide (TPR) repeat protein
MSVPSEPKADHPITDDGASARHARYGIQLTAIAMGAMLVTLLFFCPKFAFWRALPVDEIRFLPEVNRARAALQQLGDPFVAIDDPVNRAIQWRLLFPLIGHYLHIPKAVYLAMPWVGCLLVLMFVAHVVLEIRRDRTVAFLAALLAATSSWFFVSTGWLSYLDSWFVLALLAVAFARSRALLAIACLLAPWVDERFAIGLPLAVVVRVAFVICARGRSPQSLFRDAIAIGAPAILYVALRIALFRSIDTSSSDSVHESLARIHNFAALWPRALLGLWMALRVQWLLILAAVVLLVRSRRSILGLALVVAIVATAAVSAIVADDLSRSFAVLIPAAILGVVLLIQQQPRRAKPWLGALAAANLLLPASHVVYQFSVPIESAYREMARWNHPPDFLDSNYYVSVATGALQRQNFADARKSLDIAIKLDPRNTQALLNRAWLNLQTNDPAAAVRDADAALVLTPNSPDALYTSAAAHFADGEAAVARDRATIALQCAPAEWPRRLECARLVDQIDHTTSPVR